MPTVTIQYLKTRYGELMLGSCDEGLCLCDWRYRRIRTTIDTRIRKRLDSEYIEGKSDTLSRATEQLEQYFAQERRTFDIPLRCIGTDFQKQVWDALLQVGYGQTATYAQLAAKIGNPAAVRAVASANGANALSIFVPCHRIVGSAGALVGYAGGLRAKEQLLELEQCLLPLQFDDPSRHSRIDVS